MALLHTLTENLAATMLARDGIEVIWRLHLAATAAHRNGYARSAASILEIADAAEEVCRRATIDTDEPGSSVSATTSRLNASDRSGD